MIARGGQCQFRRQYSFRWAALRFAAIASIMAAGVWAQEAEPDVGEASVSTGMAVGGTKTNVMVGGAIGTSLDRYLVLMVGANFIPMGNSTLVNYPGVVAHGSGLYDFKIPLQIRIPLQRKWQPYGLMAPALIYNHYRRVGIRPDGAAYSFGASDVRGGAELGGGVRYYLHEYWGVKGEYSYTITSRNFSLLSVGVFRQF